MNTMQKFLSLYNPKDYLCVGHESNGNWTYDFMKAEDIASKNYSDKVNMFFTPNALGYRTDKLTRKPKIWKDKEHLQTLNCFYVDIDFRDAEDIMTVEDVDSFMDYINCHIIGSELPQPTMINNSGHGLHIYWLINSVPYRGNIEKWESVQRYIYNEFKRFGADINVSNDRVRLLRMCDTYNKKDGQAIVKAENIFFEENIYDFNEFISEYVCNNNIVFIDSAKRNNEKKHNTKNDNTMPTFIFSRLYNARIKDLEYLLLTHRDCEESKRECILFLYRYYQCHINQDTQKALEATLELNSKLKHPLTKKEVIKATKSAEKYYKGNQLNWKNSKIIEFLSIEECEMVGMKTIINHTEKTARKKARDRKNYITKLQNKGQMIKKDAVILRQQNIYALIQQGKDRQEICSILNISKSTYYNDLKVINTEEWKEKYSNVNIINQKNEMEELRTTGTDDCGGLRKMVKNSSKVCIPKNSVPVIISPSVTTASAKTYKKRIPFHNKP